MLSRSRADAGGSHTDWQCGRRGGRVGTRTKGRLALLLGAGPLTQVVAQGDAMVARWLLGPGRRARMAARIGDPTQYGGVITVGCPTVIIGATQGTLRWDAIST